MNRATKSKCKSRRHGAGCGQPCAQVLNRQDNAGGGTLVVRRATPGTFRDVIMQAVRSRQ
jgi:hypothetical protein